jgi:SAM-dependent methyltransferase
MSTDHDKVREYYAVFDEWERLGSGAGALEFRRALQVLDAYLPANSRVLDLGGGPGRYTLALAERGHRVVLADLSPKLLEQARARVAASSVRDRIEAIDEVNAVDLARYAEHSFDAVLAFGPFYHLVAEAERSRAASELFRVLRPAGLAFVAFVPRLSGVAGLLDRAARRPEQVPPGTLRQAADSGVFRNASSAGFQEGFYPRVSELEQLLGSAGLAVLASISLRSIADRLERELVALAEHVRAEAEALLADMSTWPEVVASSGHALVVARRPT